MSDEVSVGCTNREVFNLAFASTEIREPVNPYQMQWMAHWSQASSSSSCQSPKNRAFANVIKNKNKEQCYLPINTLKPSYTYECKHSVAYNLGKHESSSYMLQMPKTWGGDNGRFSMITSPVIRSNLESFCSEPKLPLSSMNLENFTSHQFQNSTSISSAWTHFPMIKINRRIQSTVAPKEKTSFNTMDARMNEHALPLSESPLAHQSTQFASEGHMCLQDITRTYKETSPHESEEGVPCYNCHRAKVTSSIPTYMENDLHCSGLAYKEHFANANLSYFKQGVLMMEENENLVDFKGIDVNELLSSTEVGNSSESRKGDVSTEGDSDPSSKRVKRLQPNFLDSTPMNTKRFKKGYCSSSEVQDLLSRVANYNRTICDFPGPSRGSEKEIPWIRRWCKSSTGKETASAKGTPVLCQPANLEVISENFEARQFPSLAAMALMGKQATNYRPCEFRTRGSTTVWNI